MPSCFWSIFNKACTFNLDLLKLNVIFPNLPSYSFSGGFWLSISSHAGRNVSLPETAHTNIQYRPLAQSEIRLFVLSPGTDHEPIVGSIKHREYGRGSGTSYEALSYVWGDSYADTISVDGFNIPVTTSLEIALRHLRYTDRPRTLWIDFICINQADVAERNREVSRMGLIYENADSVAIWLGPAAQHSNIGMEVLKYFAKEEKPQSCPVWQTYSQPLVHQGLLEVMTRPWFERMWVVQEIGRSSHAKFICGSDYVEWQSSNATISRRFGRMIKYAEILPEWTDLGLIGVNMGPLLEMLDYQYANQFTKPWGTVTRTAPDLLDLAHTMRFKKCADPRDKIYGIWGMVEYLSDLESFKIDYHMGVKQVYEEVARVSF